MLQRSTVWRCQLPGSMEMQPSLTQATPSAGSVSPSTGGQGGPLGATTCCTGRWWKQARTEVIAICQDGLLSGYWYFPSLFHPISGGTDIGTRTETRRCCEGRLCLFQKIFYVQRHLEDIVNEFFCALLFGAFGNMKSWERQCHARYTHPDSLSTSPFFVSHHGVKVQCVAEHLLRNVRLLVCTQAVAGVGVEVHGIQGYIQFILTHWLNNTCIYLKKN